MLWAAYGDIKTERSKRTLAVLATVAAALREHQVWQAAQQLRRAAVEGSRSVLRRNDRPALSADNARRDFRAICSNTRTTERVYWHELRLASEPAPSA